MYVSTRHQILFILSLELKENKLMCNIHFKVGTEEKSNKVQNSVKFELKSIKHVVSAYSFPDLLF